MKSHKQRARNIEYDKLESLVFNAINAAGLTDSRPLISWHAVSVASTELWMNHRQEWPC